MAIMYPLRPRMGKMTTICIVLCIWLASLLISTPNVLYSTTSELNETDGGTRTLCYLLWPDGAISLHSYQDYMYVINKCLVLITPS